MKRYASAALAVTILMGAAGCTAAASDEVVPVATVQEAEIPVDNSVACSTVYTMVRADLDMFNLEFVFHMDGMDKAVERTATAVKDCRPVSPVFDAAMKDMVDAHDTYLLNPSQETWDAAITAVQGVWDEWKTAFGAGPLEFTDD